MKEIDLKEVKRNRVRLRIYWIDSSNTRRKLSDLWRTSKFLLIITWQKEIYIWLRSNKRYQVVFVLRREHITFVVPILSL
jgi:hypothetical protein